MFRRISTLRRARHFSYVCLYVYTMFAKIVLALNGKSGDIASDARCCQFRNQDCISVDIMYGTIYNARTLCAEQLRSMTRQSRSKMTKAE
jgi:hypothetical protein